MADEQNLQQSESQTTPELHWRIKQRYDTAANWQSNNPTLLAGEIAIESDTGIIRVGDGSHFYNDLPSFHTDATYTTDGAGIAPTSQDGTPDFSNQTASIVISELQDENGDYVSAVAGKYTAITVKDDESTPSIAPEVPASVWFDVWEAS